jgi:hypothetical protein
MKMKRWKMDQVTLYEFSARFYGLLIFLYQQEEKTKNFFVPTNYVKNENHEEDIKSYEQNVVKTLIFSRNFLVLI